MAWYHKFMRKAAVAQPTPPSGSYAAQDPRALTAWRDVTETLAKGGAPSDALVLMKQVLERTSKARNKSVGVPDLGFKGARQQLFQRFNLIDLYGIAQNNSTVKTAIIALKQ